MIKKYPIIFPLLIIIVFLSSCKSDKSDDISKRNGDYVWFVEEGSSEGEWIKLTKDEKAEHLKNGHATFFYDYGRIRKTTIYDEYGKFDTIFYYNLDGVQTHLTYNKDDDYINYIINDGIFQSYAKDTSLLVSGTSVNHALQDSVFYGELRDLSHIINTTFEGFTNLKDVHEELQLSYDLMYEDSTKLDKQWLVLDSTRLFKLSMQKGLTSIIEEYDVQKPVQEVKWFSLTLNRELIRYFEFDLRNITSLLKEGDIDMIEEVTTKAEKSMHEKVNDWFETLIDYPITSDLDLFSINLILNSVEKKWNL